MPPPPPEDHPGQEPTPPDRRGLITSAAAATGLVAGYGAFAAIAARFLYPARPTDKRRMFVARVDDVPVGGSLVYRAPDGATINVARRDAGKAAESFVALSSVCPHLGCQVNWEGHNNRFYCPCHGGVFDPEGKALEGPPADADQNLSRFPLHVENGLLFIEVAVPGTRTAKAEVLDAPPGTAGARA